MTLFLFLFVFLLINFFLHSNIFMFTVRELMFADRELMFTDLELMFTVREHKMSPYLNTNTSLSLNAS